MSQALLRLTARPDPRAQRRYTSTGGVTL
jgi:hypothetical protein